MTSAPTLKISVIVPAYKPGDGIRRVIDSLAAQTMPQDEFELIIVDDGSPDDTWERLQAIREERPNVRIERIENSGWPSRPRNVGIDMARGEYLLFMDHDDEILSDGLRASYEYASAHGADVLSPKELKTSDPRWGLSNYTANIPNALPQRGIDSLLPMMPHKFYRRDFLLEHDIRFPEGRRMLWEDVYFNVACYRHAEVVSILSDTPVYLWHATDQNNSATYGPWDDEFWDKMARLLDFISTTLDTDELAAGRKKQLMHQYKSRVLARMDKYIRSGKHLDRLDNAVDRAVEIIEKHIPEEWDADLPTLAQPRAWLLRRRRIEDLRVLQREDVAFGGHTSADAMWWSEGRLTVHTTTRWTSPNGRPVRFRASGGRLLRMLPAALDDLPDELRDVTDEVHKAAAHLVLRDSATKTTWNLKPRSHVSVERLGYPGAVAEPDDGQVVTVLVTSVTRFVPGTAAQGGPIADGRWILYSQARLLGERTFSAALALGPARAAVVDGRPVVAYRGSRGQLKIDVGQAEHALLDSVKPDWGRGSVVAAGTGALRDYTVRVPVRGVHVHGDDAVLEGTTDVLVHSKADRRRATRALRGPADALLPRLVPAGGRARLVAGSLGCELVASFRAPARGRWQLFPRLAGGPRSAHGWDLPRAEETRSGAATPR